MTETEILDLLIGLPLWQEQHMFVTEKNFTVKVDAGNHKILITSNFVCKSLHAKISQALGELLPDQIVHIEQKITAHAVANAVPLRTGVKNIIAVASGKGGVGKSTIAVNVALALLAEGARVGVLDADIYGPSLPTMLGLHQPPESVDGKTLQPMLSYGLQAMSIGCLLQEKDTAMVWRGPMASTALQQLFRDCQWQDLDYLIVDLPPGTGDIQLTLSQKIPVTGAIIVTTPQNVALADAQKALTMFNKVNIPVLGVVENMSYHECSHCGEQAFIFGKLTKQALEKLAEFHLLGQLPLEQAICQDVDQGKPTLITAPNSATSQLFKQIAMRLSLQVANLAKAKINRIPPIVTN